MDEHLFDRISVIGPDYGLCCCKNNIFIERSLKQETVYLSAVKDGLKARRVSNNWIAVYSTERSGASLDLALQYQVHNAALIKSGSINQWNSHVKY